jgi:hypothetical protein
MTAEQCVAFLEALRVTQIRVKDNGWVESTCPLAKWTHKHHVDRTPSFGLSITPGQRSYFLCFACRQGSAEELLHSMELYAKGTGPYDFARCHQLLTEEQFVVPLPAYGEFHQTDQPFVEWPQYWLQSFLPVWQHVEGYTYLVQRGVSDATMKEFWLKYDPKRQMVVAPYWDVFKRFAGARGRSILEEAPHKHFDYSFQGINNARLVWFNEPVLNFPGPVVVVEGQFDCWKTAQVFPKTIANLMAKPTWEKMKKLGDCGLVIQIPDRDEAGRLSVARYAMLCQKLGVEHRVIWLDEGVKDPAECHPEYLRDKIHGAISCT